MRTVGELKNWLCSFCDTDEVEMIGSAIWVRRQGKVLMGFGYNKTSPAPAPAPAAPAKVVPQ